MSRYGDDTPKQKLWEELDYRRKEYKLNVPSFVKLLLEIAADMLDDYAWDVMNGTAED